MDQDPAWVVAELVVVIVFLKLLCQGRRNQLYQEPGRLSIIDRVHGDATFNSVDHIIAVSEYLSLLVLHYGKAYFSCS